jgi:hypothetical protein
MKAWETPEHPFAAPNLYNLTVVVALPGSLQNLKARGKNFSKFCLPPVLGGKVRLSFH